MIIGVGVDIVEITRIAKILAGRGDKFLQRIFTGKELEVMPLKPATVAGRFAAKEAVVKALGVGIGLISWQEIEIIKDKLGKPKVKLTGKALKRAKVLGIAKIHLSISHSKTQAVAYVIGEG
ncbi:holo-[acyl-carrier-protein] synthase [Anaerobranca californiensis DSM 14826]|jgi:holo-[acyl-carrier-protein] synthase|uniref:Holo-[acyl-carrier-protein] synthase n=1 Tax=Anaerobranca californiensis DSM 14826 TaxID=1120989 RepID=A0A1M6RU05_9FIRM|nr:holo-ACP synthase [Anaerobranca californiensis]SHK35880.1 holo-[acyl-carrier-protein] synthase [Anaerobranca californiensis DSM 14826]